MTVKCVLHGSFRKEFARIQDIAAQFIASGIDVIAPDFSSERRGETDGFTHLSSDISQDRRFVELKYLEKVRELGSTGFSYYVNPQGMLGTSASYELLFDQYAGVRYIFMNELRDHPAYIPRNSVWSPKALAEYVKEKEAYPPPEVPRNEQHLQSILMQLMWKGSLIATGGIIVDYSDKKYRAGQERDVLLVKTHKWGGRYSVVGGKVLPNETLRRTLKREIREETGLDARIAESICTFDELKGSGYFQPVVHRVFVDSVARVQSRHVHLNEEAEEYIWIPPTVALQTLGKQYIEPNAHHTLELYARRHLRAA